MNQEYGERENPFPYNLFGEVLGIFESQLLADDLQVSDWVDFPFHVSDIVIFKCSCKVKESATL